jgi:signal transduction histidine kinase
MGAGRGLLHRGTLRFYAAYGVILAVCLFGLRAAWTQGFDDNLVRIERDLTPAANRIDAAVESANRNINVLRASAEAFFTWSSGSRLNEARQRQVAASPLFPGYASVVQGGMTRDSTVLLIGHGDVPATDSDKGHELEMGMVLGRLFPTALRHVPDAVFFYYVSARDFVVNHPSGPVEDALKYFGPNEMGLTSVFAPHDFYALATPERNPGRREFWTPPYLDMSGMGLMCTAGAPIYTADGRFLGVVAIDVTLGRLSDILRETAPGMGEVAVIDNSLQILGHPTAITATDKELKSLTALFPDGEGAPSIWATIDAASTRFVERDGRLFRTLAVKGAPWRMVYSIERSTIVSAVAWQMRPFWLVMILLLAALFAFERRRLAVDRLRQTTEDLALARDEAQSANRIKSSLLANVSHELRTPLNAMLGMSELMRMHMFGPLGSPKYDEYMDDIHRSGQHLLALIDGLLDVTSMEAGRYRLRPEEIDVADLVHECRRMLVPLAAEAKVALVMDPPAGILRVTADRLALKQILVNLLSNAIRFTPAGGKVDLLMALDDRGTLTAAISDNGPGISETERPHLFLPFSHGNAEVKNEKQGAGLGLSIVKSLVDLHGGSIALASDPGHGCTFRITLPPCKAAA